jgi:hypothetical protein
MTDVKMVGIAKDAAKTATDALEQSRKDNAALQVQLNKQSKPEQKRYSREDLAVLVEKETISQVQADTLWDAQMRTEFMGELDKRFDNFSAANTTNTVIQNDLNAYLDALPNIAVNGTDERTKVQNEFNYLVSIGEPSDSNKTELLAIRNIFGPIAGLKTSLDTLKTETHKETGGSGQNSKSKEGSKFQDTLTAREKDHYEGCLKQGLYKDWAEVEAEMKFANSSVRKSNGAQI